MGSCGMQCMLSGLPEGRGVRTGLLFLNGRDSYRGAGLDVPRPTYDSEYCILLPPLWGKYDDYGTVKVEDEDGVLCSWAKDYLKSVGVGTAFCDFTLLQHELHQNIVKIRTTSRGRLSYALVREDVWNEMVAASVERVSMDESIYSFPKFEGPDELVAAFGQALDAELNYTDLDHGTLAHRVHHLVEAGQRSPEAYIFHLRGDSVPAEVARSAFEVFMVELLMEELGIMVHPGLAGSQLPNTRARKAFFERMMRLCDDDLADDGWGLHA